MKKSVFIILLICFSFSQNIIAQKIRGVDLSKSTGYDMGDSPDKNEKLSKFYQDGFAKMKQKDFMGAIKDYREALKLHNEWTVMMINIEKYQIHREIATAYASLKNKQEALKEMDLAISLIPQDKPSDIFSKDRIRSDYWNYRSEINYFFKDYEAVMTDINKAIGFAPKEAKLYVRRAQVQKAKGKMEEALVDYNKAVSLKPEFPFLIERAYVFLELDNPKQALTDANKAIELNPNSPQAYYIRGLSYGQLQKLQEALTDFNKVISLSPDTPDGYFWRGNVYSHLQDKDKSCADLKKAAEMGHPGAKQMAEQACK